MRKLVKKLILSLLISFLVLGYIQPKAAISGLYDHQNVIVDLLPYYEQEELKKLCESLSSSEIRHRRERSKDYFLAILSKIEEYINTRSVENKNKVAYILGYFRVDRSNILINSLHLSKILKKCKSSINSSFSNLGYSSLGGTPVYAYLQPFIESCGVDKNNFNIIRRWSCRTKYQKNQETIVQNLPGQNLPSQVPTVQNPPIQISLFQVQMAQNLQLQVPVVQNPPAQISLFQARVAQNLQPQTPVVQSPPVQISLFQARVAQNLPFQAPAAKNMPVNDISFWNNEFNFEQNFDFENFEEDIF